jgi:hypothetical protein
MYIGFSMFGQLQLPLKKEKGTELSLGKWISNFHELPSFWAS